MRLRKIVWTVALVVGTAFAGASRAADIHFVPQGVGWDGEARALFYSGDVGSRLIPLAWLRALRQPDGTPFIASLTRYGYLPNPDPANSAGLPVGFTSAASPQGRMAGLTCAACHTRQIVAGGRTFRIDGAPALVDQSGFLADLDAAVGRLVDDEAAFKTFACDVLGAGAGDDLARDMLHAEVQYWWVRFHTLVAGTLPDARASSHPSGHPWGPARMDALAMTYNSLAGLAAGPAPTYVAPANVAEGDAPLRYPFLWNAGRQDFARWTGIMEGGAPAFTLARGLGEMYGAFVTVRPIKMPGALGPLDRDYLAQNSIDVARLGRLDRLLARLGPPAWPWALDQTLADKGKAIYERPASDGGCADCHGERPGLTRQGADATWATPVLDAGTDTRAWQVVLRETGTGAMAGASLPGSVAPLAARARALDLLDIVVRGTIIDEKARLALKYPVSALVVGAFAPLTQAAPRGALVPNRYEARVLHGIWAAAPYLHNGSVPTLADLLKPAAERPRRFKVGPNYDTGAVGLAAEQSMFDFSFAATGCEDRASGDSNCGHEYGTRLPEPDKQALLEYLKTL